MCRLKKPGSGGDIVVGICSRCLEPCEVVVVDFGVGPYEFWGATGFDSRPEAVSNCCEAPAVDGMGYPITISDLDNE